MVLYDDITLGDIIMARMHFAHAQGLPDWGQESPGARKGGVGNPTRLAPAYLVLPLWKANLYICAEQI